MRALLLALCACGPTYWSGPANRTAVHEKLGPDAELEISVAWGMPDPERPRPDWLGAPGEPWSEALARVYGPRAFHNGRLRAMPRFPYRIGADGAIALAECAPIAAVGRTTREVETQIAACAARFVDEPTALIRIDANPSWAYTVVTGGKSQRVHLDLGVTLIGAVARAVGLPAVHRAVSLQLPGQPARRIDLKAIASGRAPDFPLVVDDVLIVD